MSYTPHTWVTGETITADKLNNMESGITNNDAAVSGISGLITESFATNKAYSKGDYVLYDNQLYRFTANHAAGAWTGTDVTQVVLADEVTDVNAEVADLSEAIDNIAESLLDENLIPINVGIVNVHSSQITDAASKGVTVTITGKNKFKLNGTATAAFNLAMDYDAGTNTGLVDIENHNVYFLLKRSDGKINANDMYLQIGYLDANGVFISTTDKITLFNTPVSYTYNSAAAKFRDYMHVNPGGVFNNVEFEYIILYAKPLSDSVLPDMTTDKLTIVPLTFEPKTGYITTNGTLQTYSGIYGATVDIDSNKKYRLDFRAFYGMCEVVFYDSNDTIIAYTRSYNDAELHTVEFYPPANAVKVMVEGHAANVSEVTSYSVLRMFDGNEINGTVLGQYGTSTLYGKKIAYDGDSICESRLIGAQANGGAYAKLISDATGCTYVNNAVSGGILANTVPTGTTPHSVVNSLSSMPADADLFCIEGGVNDYWLNVPLGDYSPTSNYNGSYDASTVCGALETIFTWLLYNRVGIPVVFVIIHEAQGTKSTNEAGYTFAQMREKIIGICNKHSIPYYDAYTKSGLNAYHDKQFNNFFIGANGSSDGIHPNKAGYIRYYVPQLIQLFESVIPVNN